MTFDEGLTKFAEKFGELKNLQREFQAKNEVVSTEFAAWLREQGLSEDFHLTDVMLLARRKPYA